MEKNACSRRKQEMLNQNQTTFEFGLSIKTNPPKTNFWQYEEVKIDSSTQQSNVCASKKKQKGR
jgi:hypothetical protein